MALADNPYGANIYNPGVGTGNAIGNVNHATLDKMKTMGMSWIRSTTQWSNIEQVQTNPPSYVWTQFDDFVGYANSIGLHITYPILGAPLWATINPTSSPKCSMLSAILAPAFVNALTKRYNGTTTPNPFAPGTYLYIDSYEWGNEGYDDNGTLSARDPRYLMGLNQSQSLIANCYPIIKANSPSALLGSAAMVVAGYSNSEAQIQQWVSYWYTNPGFTYQGSTLTYDKTIDHFNFHHYPGGNAGPDDPTYNVTFAKYWQAIHAATVANGDPNKPIWVGEYGWNTQNITVTQQDQFVKAVLAESKASGVIKKAFYWDLNDFTIKGSGGTENQTYTDYVAFIRNNPTWGTSTAPTYTVSPTTLSFSGTAGGANPASQSIIVTNTSASSETVSTSISSGASWLSLSPSSASIAAGTSQNFTASISLTGLAAGSYTAKITFTVGASSSTAAITLTVAAATGGPTLSVSSNVVDFFSAFGSSDATPQTINLYNTGTAVANWSFTTSYDAAGANWLAIYPVAGTIATGGYGALTFSSYMGKLAVGTYTATTTFTAGTSSVIVTTVLVISPGTSGGLLPGQVISPSGVSNFLFGTNTPNYNTALLTNTGVQTQINNANIPLIRTSLNDSNGVNYSDAMLDKLMTAITNAGALPLCILRYSDTTFSQHAVTYLGTRCNLYELSNEPDINGITWQQYLAVWNTLIPQCAPINPNAAFLGPALGVFANVQSYLVPWLKGCVASGVLPDGISYHVYPCTSSSTISQSACSTYAPNIGTAGAQLRIAVNNVLGYNLPICCTEWNIDANYANTQAQTYSANTPPNATFINQWTTSAMDSMVTNNIDLACEFEINYYLVNDANTTQAEPQLQSIAAEITKNIGGTQAATITATPATLAFSGTVGGVNPVQQYITLQNTGTAVGTWSFTGAASWLTINPTTGTLAANASVSLPVVVSLASLPVGTYTTTITFLMAGRTASCAVTLTVAAAPTGTAGGSDTFVRTNQSGWGTASDTVNVWTETGTGTASIVSNEGVLVSAGTPTHMVFGTTTSADSDMSGRFTISNAADICGLEARFAAGTGVLAATAYKLLWKSGNLILQSTVAGTTTTIGSTPFTVTPLSDYRMHLNLAGSTISGNMWTDGTSEPSGFMVTATDTAITAAGGFAIFANTATGSAGINLDAFTATSNATTDTATITETPATLTYSATHNGANPAPQNITLGNSGTISGTWTAGVPTYAGGASNWLTLASTTGTIAAGSTDTFAANVSITGLAVGSYTATVVFTMGSSTATATVTLAVNAGAGSGSIQLSPNALTFTGQVGGANPPSQSVNLINNTGATGTYSSHISVAGAIPWLTVSPGSGTLASGAAQMQSCLVNLAGMIAGTYTGTITYTLGSSTAVATITLVVAPSSGSGNALITNVGLNLLTSGLANTGNAMITYVALGTSSTPPTVNDTQLGAEVFRKAVTSYTNASTGVISISLYLAPGDAVGDNIEEIGFFGGNGASTALNSGVMLAHGLYQHNPKTSAESIQFQLQVTFLSA